jgi:hypothetical protein
VIRALPVALALAAAAPAADVEPVSLAGWSGKSPPGFVADDHRFTLTGVRASFETRHDRNIRGESVAGAVIRIDGMVSPPDPRTIMGDDGTITVDEIADHRGRSLITAETQVQPPLPIGARLPFEPRSRLAVRTTITRLSEVPARIESLAGRAAFSIAESVESVRVPAVVSDALVEVAPGFSVRVTEVLRRQSRIRVYADYAIRNADDGYERGRPPCLLDVQLIDDDGQPLPRAKSTVPVRNPPPVTLHTGLHGVFWTEATLEEDAPAPVIEIDLVTAVRTAEIPFHFTDIELSLSPPDEGVDESALPRYGADELPRPFAVEHDDLLLTLQHISAEHFASFRSSAELTTMIRGALALRMPPGRWAHAQAPTIASIVDHRGRQIDFEQVNLAGASLVTPYREVKGPQSVDVGVLFICRHTRPPIAGLSELRGALQVWRATATDTAELPWAAREEAEAVPGLSIEIGAPVADGRKRSIPIKIARTTDTTGAGRTMLPHVLDIVALNAEGAELATMKSLAGVDEFETRTIQRGEIAVRNVTEGREPVRLRIDVIVEAEDVRIPFSFTGLPLRVDR